MKKLETIFMERRIAVDGVVICPIEDWNDIVCQVCDLQDINQEMYAMLDDVVKDAKSYESRSGKLPTWATRADKLLARARGES